jgi:hypothetical protein
MNKIPLKILTSPIREPFWKYRAVSLKKYHFVEANRVQFHCSYINKKGKLEFPFLYEIDSKVVFDYIKNNPHMQKSDRYIIPIILFDKIERRKEIKNVK